MPRPSIVVRLAFPVSPSLQGAARAVVAAMGILTTLVGGGSLGAQQARPVAPPVTPPVTQPVTQPAAQPAAQPARRDTSSLPFHDDQWGMDFGVSGSGTYRIGAVKFTSPTRAWILDASINGQIARQEVEPAFSDTLFSVNPSDQIRQGGSVSLLVGRRAYRSLGARAMRTVSFAVGGGFGYDESLAGGERTSRQLTSNALARFGVGGHYRVTPSLALGATFGLYASYAWSDSEGAYGKQRSQYFNAGLGSSELTLSLFF